jgi:hypothetical protein
MKAFSLLLQIAFSRMLTGRKMALERLAGTTRSNCKMTTWLYLI